LNRVFLIVPPFLFLAVSLATFFFSFSIGAYHSNAQTLAERNAALRLIAIGEIALTVFLVLVLPRLLHAILPDKIEKTADPVPVHHSVPVHLTSRQRVVMGLLAEDPSNKQIAIKLNITERTAKFHITSLMTEFGVHNRYELGRLARKMIEGKEL
jgi:DNA-binding NarL/FixJ family response regulator